MHKHGHQGILVYGIKKKRVEMNAVEDYFGIYEGVQSKK